MDFRFFAKYIPTAHELRSHRFLRPFSKHLDHHSIWQFNQRSVAGGVAVGLFFGILVPFMQIFLAAAAAIILRVNLPMAAFSTLVTNPFTFPVVYYSAYRLGDVLTGNLSGVSSARVEAEIQNAAAIQQGKMDQWGEGLINWVQTVGLPLMTGLLVLATVAAVSGYFLVKAVWQIKVRWRWHGRRTRRKGGT
jgi:uncharacterized protein (DUF2062 family)